MILLSFFVSANHFRPKPVKAFPPRCCAVSAKCRSRPSERLSESFYKKTLYDTGNSIAIKTYADRNGGNGNSRGHFLHDQEMPPALIYAIFCLIRRKSGKRIRKNPVFFPALQSSDLGFFAIFPVIRTPLLFGRDSHSSPATSAHLSAAGTQRLQ